MMPSYDRSEIVAMMWKRGVPEYKMYHVQGIERLCMHVVDELQKAGLQVNRDYVTAAALLHDIALAVIPDDMTPNHCFVGADMARALGYPEEVARCIECHESIMDREMGKDLGVKMIRDHYIPETLEEKIIFLGDHAMVVLGECARDLWGDRFSMAKSNFPYMQKAYRRWANKEIDPSHPAIIFTQKIDDEMRQYLTREGWEAADVQTWVKKMQAAFPVAGVQFPFDYADDIVIPV
jgi:putative nucleotidyltransferase with HDIG domain